MVSRVEIRIRKDANGYYAANAGQSVGFVDTAQEALQVVAAMVNGAEFEVVMACEDCDGPCVVCGRTT